MEGWVVLAVLTVLAVPVLLIVALVMIGGVKRRVGDLEMEVAMLRERPSGVHVAREEPRRHAAPVPAPQTAAPPTTPPVIPAPAPGPARPVTLRDDAAIADIAFDAAAGRESPDRAASDRVEPDRAEPGLAPPEASPRLPPRAPMPPPPPSGPTFGDRVIVAVKRWFTEGNVPVKIGMLVLLAGVAALLKYASDQGWLQMPIELRLAGVTVAALAGLAFGWKQRVSKPAFALALQGGAIGVLLLTVFAAFKLYGLMPAAAAFGLSVALVAGLGVLAVMQDSRTLAVLGILAGFLAPIWLSTGSGSHVALFSYYALLNAAIFAIAWVRPWRVLNLLGFVFTFGIGTAWGVLQYDPAKYASTQPFLLLFFAFYLAIPILYAWRSTAQARDRIDGSLLFGTPLVAFSLQAALLDGARMPLALWALGLAVVYAVLASLLVRRARFAVLGQAHAILAVGFATLSVPLALSARATASVFALEGAGLVWLGLAQGRRLPRWTGVALQAAAAVALMIGWDVWRFDDTAIANATFMGALLIALAGFASAWAYRDRGQVQVAALFYGWGLLWWVGNAINEVDRFVEVASRADVLLAVAAFTGWLAAELHRRRPAPALVLTTLAGFVVALPLAFAQTHAQPFAGYGGAAWLVFVVLGTRSLICLRGVQDRFAPWAQFAWWLVWSLVLSLFARWTAGHFDLAQGWQFALIALPWLALSAISLLHWPWLTVPLGARFDVCRMPLQATVLALLGLGWCLSLLAAGDPAPLPWLPLVNPLELAQLAVLGLLARWLWSPTAVESVVPMRIPLLAAAAFALVTCSTLRTVHHWGNLPWDGGLASSMLAQTSLTVVWSVLGVAGWILGSRRGQRALWLAGAVLMGVVLAKLVLVDRQHLGNLLGIGSFIAYGLLCTLVGYFAPAPPRAAPDPGEAVAVDAA